MCVCALGMEFAKVYGGSSVFRIEVLRGRDAVLSRVEELEALTERVGQDGAALGLEYVLEEEFAARKMPYLVCLSVDQEGATRLAGAALLFEYRIGRMGTGLIATGDSFGVRTVFGAESLRGEVAVASAKALLERGARLVLASFKQEKVLGSAPLPMRGTGFQWTVGEREVQDTLTMRATLDETLAGLGKRTRTRLRAFRRRFDGEVRGEFVADALGELKLEDDSFMVELNEASLEPIEQATFNLQVRSTGRLRGGFICGLNSPQRGWLALAGGWRQGHTTWVEWQVNVKGLEKFSLSSVLRSYLLEEEARRGTQRLGFHGSTSHSMAHSFLQERVVDVLARRRSVVASLLVWVVPVLFCRVKRMARRGNFLGDALSREDLTWTKGDG